MKSGFREKWPGYLIAFLLTFGIVVWVALSKSVDTFEEKYEGVDLSRSIIGIGRDNAHSLYLERHADSPLGTGDVDIDLSGFSDAKGVSVRTEEGRSTLLTEEGSRATWKVLVENAGLYNIELTYHTITSRGVDMERSLQINGETPFLGADTLLFSRMWTDDGVVRTDNQGNQIRPPQQEVLGWQTVLLKDPLGYEKAPYRFYFHQGENTVSFTATDEPMLLGALRLKAVQEELPYAQYWNGQKPVADLAAADTLAWRDGGFPHPALYING